MSVPPGPRLVQESESALLALRVAADRVAAGWPHGSGAGTEEVSGLLDSIYTAVAGLLSGKLSPLDARLVSDLGHRLIELVRAELARLWTRSESLPHARQIVDLWRALEEVRTALEPDLPDDLAGRFSGRDGLNLVVEMAHDLRSPLTSILSLAELLHSGQSGQVNDLQKRQLGLVYEAALQLSALASDVLELVRGGSGLADDQPSPFSISEVIDSVQEMVTPIAEKRELTLKLIRPPRDHRYGHPQALSRVLLNLTTNALKFTEKGFVEIAARARGLTIVEFSVRDTGSGIPREALDTLYEPFRRVPGGGGFSFSGTGLGLAICRKLVRAMGSDLRVVTGAWGTQFSFELDLPLADLQTTQRRGSRWAQLASMTNPRRISRRFATVAAAVILMAIVGGVLWQYQPTLIPRNARVEQQVGAPPPEEVAQSPAQAGETEVAALSDPVAPAQSEPTAPGDRTGDANAEGTDATREASSLP
ncbi:MAG: HAMP domain-containing histidine kinase [Gemmatimonadota bacterium]|nr:MAG: HAMP domain-containing histidine kinase [Gemmatimonadota bacterium]